MLNIKEMTLIEIKMEIKNQGYGLRTWQDFSHNAWAFEIPNFTISPNIYNTEFDALRAALSWVRKRKE